MKIKIRRKGVVIPNRKETENAWDQAETLPGFDPSWFRVSADGLQAMIRRDRLNNRRPFGWTVRDGKAICFGDLSVLTELSDPGPWARRALH